MVNDMAVMVSIDSSTKKTGLAKYVNGVLDKYQLVDLSSIKQIDHRMNQMGLSLIALLDEWMPDMVYIEEPKGEGRNVELVRKLAEIIGIVRGWCISHECYYEEIKPSVWRAKLGIKQGARKREELKAASMEYVKTKYGIEPETDDVADAICIGLAVLNGGLNG